MSRKSELEAELKRRGIPLTTTLDDLRPAGKKPQVDEIAQQATEESKQAQGPTGGQMLEALGTGGPAGQGTGPAQPAPTPAAAGPADTSLSEDVRAFGRGATGGLSDMLGAGLATAATSFVDDTSFMDRYRDIRGMVGEQGEEYGAANPDRVSNLEGAGTAASVLLGGGAGLARAAGTKLGKKGLSKAMEVAKGRSSGLGAAFNTPSASARVGRSLRRMGSKAASTGLPKAKGAAGAIGRKAKNIAGGLGRGAKWSGKKAGQGAVGYGVGEATGIGGKEGAALAMGFPGMLNKGSLSRKMLKKLFL